MLQTSLLQHFRRNSMKNILIIGATGSLGETLRRKLANQDQYQLTLFSRGSNLLRLNENEQAMAASVFEDEKLNQAMQKQDIVFVALSGNLPEMIKPILKVMYDNKVKRIVFVSSIGIYNEIRGSGNISNNPILQPYRQTADIVEESGLDYTILRPAWFDNGSDTICQISLKGETVTGHDVSRKAIIELVSTIIDQPERYLNQNIALFR